MVREVKTSFQQPFANELEYKNKKFNFLFECHAVAEETQGEEIFKKGDGEKFWDFSSKDSDYLSLGINDKTNERLDFFGEVVEQEQVEIF